MPRGNAGLAQAGRNRLDPADQALLDAWDVEDPTGPEYDRSVASRLAGQPRPLEIWYELGDAYYHNGGLVGLDEPAAGCEPSLPTGLGHRLGGRRRFLGRAELAHRCGAALTTWWRSPR